MKKLAALVVSLFVLALLLAGCGTQSGSGGKSQPGGGTEKGSTEKFVIKMGYGTAPGHPIDLASQKFKEIVEKKSNGRIEVKLFPSAQLGSERQLIEGLMAGTVEMTPTTTGPMGLFDPAFFVFDLPYIFKDHKSVDKVLDGPIGQEMLKRLEKLGIVGLAWWENGFRELTNNVRPVVKPEDLKGIKLRTMENEVHMKFFKQLGATPVPLGFGEIYMALKTKTVDGQENPLSIIAANKFYEVQKYLTRTSHVYSPVVVLVSKKFWDQLPNDLRQIIRDTAYELREFERNSGRENEKQYIDTIKQNGVEITELTPEQKALWRAEAEKIYPDFEGKIGKELLDKVRKAGWQQ